MSAQVIPEPRAAGTMTTVDIDLLDSNGARWVGAKVQVTFVAPPHTPAPYLFDGAEFQMYYYFETIGPTGHFTIDLPSNLDITPRGEESFWRFDIAPNIDDGRSVPITVQLSTSAQDLSQAFTYATSLIVQWPVQSIPVPRASGDFDVIVTPNDGQLYFDVTMQVLKVWANGGWQVVEGGGGGGGGISYPPPGIPVSQGTAWGTSIDPATLVTQSQLTANYLPLAGGTLTGQLNFGDAGAFIQRSAQYEVIFGSPARLYFYNGYGAGYTMVTGWNNPGSIGGPDQASNCTIALTPLYLSSDPTSPPQAATKQYVDAKQTQIIQVADQATAIAQSTANPTNIYYWPGSSGGGGSMVYPPVGIGVSTGSAWGTSIDPTTLATTAALANYLPLTGGNLSGALGINGSGGLLYLAGNVLSFYNNGSVMYTNMDWGWVFQRRGTACFSVADSNYSYGSNVSYLPLVLAADPTAPLQAATKQYVDNTLTSGYLPLSGGTLTGDLQVNTRVVFGGPASANWPSIYNFDASGNWLTLSGYSGVVLTGPTLYFGSPSGSGYPYIQNTAGGNKLLLFGYNDVVFTTSAGTALDVSTTQVTSYLPLVLPAGSYVAPIRTQSQMTITNNPLGFYIINTNAATDQKFSYYQVANSSSSGTVHMGFQNDAGTQNHDYLTVVPAGNKSSLFYLNSDIIYFSSGDSSTAYGNIDTNGSLNIGKIQIGDLSGSNPRHLQLTFNDALNGGTGGGIIQALEEGIAYTNVYISPNGGNIYIGVATDNTTVTSSLYVGNFAALGSKTFLITHPLDESKELVHACLEGPENGVYYRGQGVTNDYGEAEISLPEYFEALTRPYGRTVILTAIYEDDDEDFGQVACSVVLNGKFHVRSQYAEQGFYWEVKGVRSDLAPLEVEKDKLERVH